MAVLLMVIALTVSHGIRLAILNYRNLSPLAG
jgi:hypothetical protein